MTTSKLCDTRHYYLEISRELALKSNRTTTWVLLFSIQISELEKIDWRVPRIDQSVVSASMMMIGGENLRGNHSSAHSLCAQRGEAHYVSHCPRFALCESHGQHYCC